MSFNPAAGNAGLQPGGGGDAPKQSLPSFGVTKPFGAAPGIASAAGGFGGASTGFNFGGSASSTAPTATAFSLSAPTSAPSSGFSFGANSGASAPAPSFGAVATTSTPTQAAPAFSLGSTPSSFSLGTTTAPGSATGFTLGSVSTASAPSGFSLSTTPAASTAPALASGGFSLSSGTSTLAPTSFGFGAPTSTPSSSGLSLGVATPATSAPAGFSLGVAAPTTSSTSLSLGGTGTSSAAPAIATSAPLTSSASFSFPTASSTTTPSFGSTTTTSTPLTFNLGSLAASSTTSSATTTTTDTTQNVPIASLNYAQLEETINKWTMDLEEQEKLFMLQATQVNAWDRTLTSNGEKIEALNKAVETVKMEQQRLDNELEFICSQQRELEDCLAPLEKELAGNAVTDPEREHTYELAANMDTQLKQMSEDLKEIIENLNERNRAQDSTDPLVQIGRILNSHMDSLQWIEHNTHAIQNNLDQVSKLHESHRRDNERSFHLTYD